MKMSTETYHVNKFKLYLKQLLFRAEACNIKFKSLFVGKDT